MGAVRGMPGPPVIHPSVPAAPTRPRESAGHTITPATAADYIPDVEAENPLSEPVAALSDTNVVNLRARQSR
jgi:hypothetical protein